jgi:hypothetical protein
MSLDKFRHAETDANRVRKLNLMVDSTNAAAAAGSSPVNASIATTDSSGGMIKTVITLSGLEVTMTDATTAGSHGSVKLYDFPECNMFFLGGTASLTLTAGAGGITDTAAAVVSVGTVTAGVDNATLTTTEADLIPSTAATLSGGVGTAAGITLTAGAVAFDGTDTAKDAWLNIAVPDAGSTANDTFTVSGTITLVWSNLGDV